MQPIERYISNDLWLRVYTNPYWHDWSFDWKTIKKHGVRGMPIILGDLLDMARKKQNAQNNRGTDNGVRWVNVPITTEDEVQLIERGIDDLSLLTAILEVVSRGYTFGFKPTTDGEGFMAYLVCTVPDDPNNGHGLTAFAGSERDALVGLVFKHVVLCDGIWPVGEASEGRRFR